MKKVAVVLCLLVLTCPAGAQLIHVEPSKNDYPGI
jgi:hypothetical protein